MTTLGFSRRRPLIVGCALGWCLLAMTSCADPSGSTEPATHEDLFQLTQTASTGAGPTGSGAIVEDGKGPTSDGVPVRLQIPRARIDAEVETVGLTDNRALASASSDMRVAWYEDGFRLGEPGNVVLTGHVVEHRTGAPGGLRNIESVTPGDDVIVTSSGGAQADYVVTDVAKAGLWRP